MVLGQVQTLRSQVVSTSRSSWRRGAPQTVGQTMSANPVTIRQRHFLSLGLCRQCGKQPNTVGTRCVDCNAKDKKRAREYRLFRISIGVCQCGKPLADGKRRCLNCLYVASGKQSDRNYDLKVKVLGHYGGECSCCGEREPDFLNMDHIAGGGTRHRKQDPATNFIYKWLHKSGYPEGFRILCSNCNLSARLHEGVCIHQLVRDAFRPDDELFETTTKGDPLNV